MKLIKNVLLTSLLSMSLGAIADGADVQKVKDHFIEKGAETRVTGDAAEFRNRITAEINRVKPILVQMVGFSGVGYSDIDTYKREVLAQLETIQERNPGKPITVLLGGSKDGFGAAYEVLHENKYRFSDLRVAGMISNAIVEFIEYDPLSSKQGNLLIYTPHEAGSFELKSGPNQLSETVKVMGDSRWGKTYLIAHEGGKIAITETLEYLMEGQNNRNAANNKVVLTVGYEGEKVKNMGAGYRAAMQTAYILHQFPELLGRNISVEVKIPGIDTPRSIADFFQHQLGFEMARQIESAIKEGKVEIPERWFERGAEGLPPAEERMRSIKHNILSQTLADLKEALEHVKERNPRLASKVNSVIEKARVFEADLKSPRSAPRFQTLRNLADGMTGRVLPAGTPGVESAKRAARR